MGKIAFVRQLLTHIYVGVSHTFTQLLQGSELVFSSLSTVLLCGYYYYLYIYKSRFQADHSRIRFPLLDIKNNLNTEMNLRATA